MSGGPFDSLFAIGGRVSGAVLGAPYVQYRPTAATNPIVSGNIIGTLSAWITADMQGRSAAPFAFGKAIVYGQFDPTLAQVGDILTGPLGTLFVASLDAPAPMQLVRCNRTATISQPPGNSAKGMSTTYGGDIVANETPICASWPCWIERGTKGEVGDAKLPGDVKLPWFNVILPNVPGVTLRNNMILRTDQGFRHIVSSAEQSPLGWRLTIKLATT